MKLFISEQNNKKITRNSTVFLFFSWLQSNCFSALEAIIRSSIHSVLSRLSKCMETWSKWSKLNLRFEAYKICKALKIYANEKKNWRKDILFILEYSIKSFIQKTQMSYVNWWNLRNDQQLSHKINFHGKKTKKSIKFRKRIIVFNHVSSLSMSLGSVGQLTYSRFSHGTFLK